MDISINNFGPVRGKQNYSIDLEKNITLVTGGNGLGKTYLGYIVYSFIRNLKNPLSPITEFDFCIDNIDKLLPEEKLNINIDKSLLERYFDSISDLFKDNIHKEMGIDKRSAEMIFSNLKISLLNIDEIYNTYLDLELNAQLTSSNIQTFSFRKKARESNIEMHRNKTNLPDNYLAREIVNISLGNLICNYIFTKSIIGDVYYIPVERNSLYTFSKELSLKRSEMIDKMQSFLLDDNKETEVPSYLRQNANRYPKAIDDALKQAQDLHQITKNEAEEKYISLAHDIENDILKGKVLINKDGEVEFSPRASKSKSIPVHLSASFIKTISSIVFFLKHIAKNGDLLMIDEPEMNLHPNLQIELTRILSRIANSGIKIWISTHSDYVIAEINNLCLVDTINKAKKHAEIEKWGYAKDLYIDKDKMQALYFDDTLAKTQVKIINLPISDTGVDIASIDNTLYELNQRTNEILDVYENMGE